MRRLPDCHHALDVGLEQQIPHPDFHLRDIVHLYDMADIRFRQAVEPLHVIDGAVVIAPGEVGAKQRIEMLLRVVRLSVFTLRRNMTTVGVGLDGAVGGGVFRSGFLCREPLGQRFDFASAFPNFADVVASGISCFDEANLGSFSLAAESGLCRFSVAAEAFPPPSSEAPTSTL